MLKLKELFELNAPPAWKYCQSLEVVPMCIPYYLEALVEDAFGYGHASKESVDHLIVSLPSSCE